MGNTAQPREDGWQGCAARSGGTMVGWGPIGKKYPRLQAQKPLLDGGEGKSLDKNIVNNIADVTSGLPKDTDVGLGQISEQTGGFHW